MECTGWGSGVHRSLYPHHCQNRPICSAAGLACSWAVWSLSCGSCQGAVRSSEHNLEPFTRAQKVRTSLRVESQTPWEFFVHADCVQLKRSGEKQITEMQLEGNKKKKTRPLAQMVTGRWMRYEPGVIPWPRGREPPSLNYHPKGRGRVGLTLPCAEADLPEGAHAFIRKNKQTMPSSVLGKGTVLSGSEGHPRPSTGTVVTGRG